MRVDSCDLKREVSRRRRKFAALLIGIMLGIMPTTTVMADTYNVNDLSGKDIKTGDVIKFPPVGSGSLAVLYYNNKGKQQPFYETDWGYGSPAEVTVRETDLGDITWTVKEINNHTFYVEEDKYVEEQGDDPICCTVKLQPKSDAPTPGPGGGSKSGEEVTCVDPEYMPYWRWACRNGDEEEEESTKPVIFNPDAINAHFIENGVINGNIQMGKQEQGAAAMMAFRSMIPAGWKEAFTFSMSNRGKNDYSLKKGKIVMYVPDQYQKVNRQYAILSLDKNGVVSLLLDTDSLDNMLTVDTNMEGYAFMLIYKD